MYICEQCGEQSKPGEKQFSIALELRPKSHSFRPDANRLPDGSYTDDPGGQGLEIVRAAHVCANCASGAVLA